MKRFVAFLTLLVGVFQNPLSIQAEIPQVQLSQEERSWIKSHSILKVGNENDWPPFDFAENGKPLGYSIDYLILAGKKVGLEFEFINGFTWSQLLDKLRNRELDILPAIMDTPERRKFMTFTEHYMVNPTVIVTKDTDTNIHSISDLSGHKVAIVEGYYYEQSVKSGYPDVQVVSVSGFLEGLEAVIHGDADAFIGSQIVVHHTITGHFLGGLHVAGRSGIDDVDRFKIRFGVPKGEDILVSILEKGMNAITQDEKQELANRWIQVPELKKTTLVTLTNEERKWLRAHPRIRVHNEMDWPPFNFNQSGTPKGYSIEFMNILADKLGLKVDYISGPSWGEFLGMMRTKNLDVMLNIIDTDDRRKFIRFTSPYVENPPVIIARENDSETKFFENLSGRTVAIPRGFFYQELIERNFPDIKLILLKDQLESLRAVAFGKADATVGGLAIQNYLIRQNLLTNLKVAGGLPKIFSNRLRIGVRDDWPILRDILQKAIVSVTEEEAVGIQTKWLGAMKQEKPSSSTDPLTLFLQTGTVIVVIVALIFMMTIVVKHLNAKEHTRLYESRELKGLGVLLLSLLLCVVVASAWFSMQNIEKQTRMRMGSSLQTVLQSTREALLIWVDRKKNDLQAVSSSPELSILVEDLLAVERTAEDLRSSAELAAVRRYLSGKSDKIGNTGFFIIAPGGTSLGSKRDANVGTTNLIYEQRREIFDTVIQGRTVLVPPIVSDVSLKSKYGEVEVKPPTMFFASPVRDRTGDKVVAVLTMRLDPSKDFTRITQLGRIGRSGETYAFDDQARLISDSRFDNLLRQAGIIPKEKNAILNISIRDPGGNLLKGHPLPSDLAGLPMTLMATQATAKSNGVNIAGYRDYRGVPVMGAWLWDDSLGLGITTEIDVDEAMATYRETRNTILGVLGVTLLIVFVLSGVSISIGQSANRSLRRARDDLEIRVSERTEELEHKSSLLEAVLSSINQGLVAYDEKLKLIVSNARFREIRDVPEELSQPGAAFSDWVNFDAQRGEFGDDDPEQIIREQILRANEFVFHRFERTRPNGAIIEIEGGPLPKGGFVSTFTDITERKTAEMNLRDAYDIISQSIQYASRIQESFLPDEGVFDSACSEHFVLWQPRDMVGGDMYWHRYWGNGDLILLGDCTGHGVPGAFMTLISNGALDKAYMEIVPGDIAGLLQRMHQLIQQALRQDEEDGPSDDGLELGACYISPDRRTLTFAGARFSLYETNKDGVNEIKGDRSGLGYRRISPNVQFTNRNIDLHAGNRFYMTSDGLIDQVGGERNRSFGKKRFKALLASMSEVPMAAQAEQIQQALTDYQGNQIRRDDIAVLGFGIAVEKAAREDISKPIENLIEFSAEISVGFDEIDDDHKKLINLVNWLNQAVRNGSQAEISPALNELIDYTNWHFRHEERLMQEHRYPELGPHEKEHDELREKVTDIYEKFENGETEILSDVPAFLSAWLVHHIQETDKKLGSFLSETI